MSPWLILGFAAYAVWAIVFAILGSQIGSHIPEVEPPREDDL